MHTSPSVVLALFSQFIQQQRNIHVPESKEIFDSLFDLSKLLQEVLVNSESIKAVATSLKNTKSILQKLKRSAPQIEEKHLRSLTLKS